MNSAFGARRVAGSEVISQVLFTPEHRAARETLKIDHFSVNCYRYSGFWRYLFNLCGIYYSYRVEHYKRNSISPRARVLLSLFQSEKRTCGTWWDLQSVQKSLFLHIKYANFWHPRFVADFVGSFGKERHLRWHCNFIFLQAFADYSKSFGLQNMYLPSWN